MNDNQEDTLDEEKVSSESETQDPQEENKVDEAENKVVEVNLDYKDKYLRLLAENENLRRRTQKESQESIRYATRKIILDLLLPLDQLEGALGHAKVNPSEEVQNWALGFKMILQQFKDWLQGQGVQAFSSLHQIFDPKLHEAVETVESREHKEGIIIKELARGYKMGDHLLRAAKVVVAKAPEIKDEKVQEENETGTDAEEQKL